MKLSVPFIPDEKYTSFLKNKTPLLESVYFALPSGSVLDSRMRFKNTQTQLLVNALKGLAPLNKYCLLNSRFILPSLYNDDVFLNETMDQLEYLTSEAGLTGIVFCDLYFLNALLKTKRTCLSNLEAVPSINMMMDKKEKVVSMLDMICQTSFRLPGKIILDRSLNRELEQLESISKALRSQYPDMKIELLANEGCIFHCPFKPAHDAHISLANTSLVKEQTLQLNNNLGCARFFFNHIEKFFMSPFIRPEDVMHYNGLADTIKLCGRTIGTHFLKQTVNAYINQSYNGNLFDLMDATNWLTSQFFLDNKKLDPGFFKLITSCTKDCRPCIICENLSLKAIKRIPLHFKQYEDFL
ncbi:MAG: hypothetical protein GY729_11300 [Desulfobacteraceae bacterium]|nr:hypothetical protein [Desulfobacteraceae bacterium]